MAKHLITLSLMGAQLMNAEAKERLSISDAMR